MAMAAPSATEVMAEAILDERQGLVQASHHDPGLPDPLGAAAT
jgi:hypothetical protein